MRVPCAAWPVRSEAFPGKLWAPRYSVPAVSTAAAAPWLSTVRNPGMLASIGVLSLFVSRTVAASGQSVALTTRSVGLACGGGGGGGTRQPVWFAAGAGTMAVAETP